jgi:CubicO group peptidase (beta-lactamase class C family)
MAGGRGEVPGKLTRVSAAAAVARFAAAVDDEGLGAYGVHVAVGDDEAQHRWRSDDRENLYSVSKGVCSLAAGIAIGEGILRYDTTVAEALPEMQLGDGVAGVTLGHFLTMRSGIDFQWFGDDAVPWPDLAQEMLRRPTRGPGTVFQYSDASTYLAMRMLGSAVGDVRDWLVPRLFDPLGITNPQWHRCPLGWIIGGSDLYLRTGELARIGQLLRDRGRWRGRSLVDAAWIDRMHGEWQPTGGGAPFERYGIAAWDGPGTAWRLDGRYGQYVIVDQTRDAVVTITAHEESRDHRLAELAVEALN